MCQTSSIHCRVSMLAVKIGLFYTNRVPYANKSNSNLNRIYSIYSGMLNILNTKSRLGWNEVTVSITKQELITPRQHEDNVYIYQYTESNLKGFSFSNMFREAKCGSGFITDAEKKVTLNLCFKKGSCFGPKLLFFLFKSLLTRLLFQLLCLEKSTMCD